MDTELIFAGSDNFGNSIFTVNETTGTKMVVMGSRSGSGFCFHGYNMTGQDVVQIYADSRGGGAVGVSNLAGEGRVFKGKLFAFLSYPVNLGASSKSSIAGYCSRAGGGKGEEKRDYLLVEAEGMDGEACSVGHRLRWGRI